MELQNTQSDLPSEFSLKPPIRCKEAAFSPLRNQSMKLMEKCSPSTLYNSPLHSRVSKRNGAPFPIALLIGMLWLSILSLSQHIFGASGGWVPSFSFLGIGVVVATSLEDTSPSGWRPPAILKLSPETTNFTEYPHNTECFTEGYVMYEADKVLESCGMRGKSSLLNYFLSTGTVISRHPLPLEIFAEGIATIGEHIYILTYRSQKALVLDKDNKDVLHSLPFDTESLPHWKEGWGMTNDFNFTIYATDGTAKTGIIEIDALTFKVKRSRQVFCDKNGIIAQENLNELEFIPTESGGILLANIWYTSKIVVIDVPTGACIAIVELTDPELYTKAGVKAEHGMNGILWHPSLGDDIVVTGKNWDKAFRFPLLSSLRNLNLPTMQTSRDITKPYQSEFLLFVSFFFGVTYTLLWVLSFYPQVWMNFKRKRVDGMSFDLLVYNLVGYIAYSTYTVGQYVAQQAAHANNAVEPQDTFFAVHSLFICLILAIQCLIYYRGQQKVGNFALGLCGLYVVATVVIALFAAHGMVPWISTSATSNVPGENIWQHFIKTLTFFSFLGYVKATITIVKYMPQVHLNFVNKSTEGMSILNFTLDFLGGLLSLLQNVVDAWNYSDISFLVDNVPKLVISMSGLIYDSVLHGYKRVSDIEIQLSPISDEYKDDFPHTTTFFTKRKDGSPFDSSSSSPSTIDPFQ
ncbi:putative Glutaminyl-peptide cyclotransferase [Cardiosporidium cionae]|uniref:Glutaminyl-peptide cyclotransferase n=1 Tax=Cardiosporidium cionae TaxID=476202 RepID=A0ABQ7J7T0_9APIC|nr:putative Glutaminyl-peptide cyclotransferase [Cardiosporidium cionae]|eukprot:KAF8820037.1 putative Glutaminyl-peptide cyclotransferase [Cardiosporidium cionae]